MPDLYVTGHVTAVQRQRLRALTTERDIGYMDAKAMEEFGGIVEPEMRWPFAQRRIAESDIVLAVCYIDAHPGVIANLAYLQGRRDGASADPYIILVGVAMVEQEQRELRAVVGSHFFAESFEEGLAELRRVTEPAVTLPTAGTALAAQQTSAA